MNMHLNQNSTKNNYQNNIPNNNRSIFSASTIESDVCDNINNNVNNSVNLNIKEDCISCSNNKEQLVQAYKLACLNYKSSNLNMPIYMLALTVLYYSNKRCNLLLCSN
jgi:protein-arginine kinase activator protein McsA